MLLDKKSSLRKAAICKVAGVYTFLLKLECGRLLHARQVKLRDFIQAIRIF